MFKKYAVLALLAALAAGRPAAAEPAPSAAVSTSAPSAYTIGMDQRKRGDYAGARETFLKMLEAAPDNGGALEGLALSCLSLGRYDEARGALDRWNAMTPRNAYILGLLARAQNGQRDYRALAGTYAELAALDPRDCALRTRLDSYDELFGYGVFPRAKAYRTYSVEGLDTASPQRIIYEGASASAQLRMAAGGGLYALGGAEVRREAQKNDGGNFTYYNVQEQVYSAGLGARYAGGYGWEAQYGQSLLSDLKSPSYAPLSFGRARLEGYWLSSSLVLNSAPRLVRLPGGPRFFRVLRENSVRAESGRSLWGWDWTARGGLAYYDGGAALGSAALRGYRDLGAAALRAGYSRGQQEFYSASPSGRYRSVGQDVFDAGLRRTVDGVYSAGAYVSQTYYTDGNRLLAPGLDLTGWLPWYKEFSAGYRFTKEDFRRVSPGYNSADTREHWLGIYWRHCRGRNWSAGAGYEKGFLRADSRGYYRGNTYLADAEWYAGKTGSIRVQAKKRDTTVRDRAWSAELQARYSFR